MEKEKKGIRKERKQAENNARRNEGKETWKVGKQKEEKDKTMKEEK